MLCKVADLGKGRRVTFTIFPREVKGSLLLAFCLLLLLFLLLGFIALQQVQEVKGKMELVAENYGKGSLTISQLGHFALDLNIIANEGVSAADSQARTRWEERLRQTKAEIDSYITDQLQDSPTLAEREAWEELQRGVDDYWKALEKEVKLLRRQSSRDASLRSETSTLIGQRKLQVESGKLFSLHEKAALKHQEEIYSSLGQFRTRALLLTGLTLLLGISIMYFTLRDIQAKTDRIKEERDFSQTLIETIGDGVVLFNLQGMVEFANRKFTEMLGYRPEEILEKSYPQLFHHPGDSSEPERQYQASQDNDASTFESLLIRADGSSFPALVTEAPRLDEAGRCLGSVAVFRDISETKQAERSLQQLARALEETDECVVITDLEEKITYVNKAAKETYGYRVAELMGRHVSLLRTLDDHLFLGEEIRAASLSGVWRGEVMNRRKSGETFPIFLTTSLLQDERGTPYAIVGISRDISERKRIEQEILHRNRDLASLNAITATMSQSLNLHQTLEKAVDQTMEALDLDGCEIYIREEEAGRLVQVASRGMEKDYFQQRSLPDIEPQWPKPMALTEESIITNDLQKDGLYPSLLSQGFLSFASAPIKSKGAILGVLNAARKKPGIFTAEEIELLVASANQMGMFIENVRSFEREKQRVEELSSLIQVAQAVNSSLDLQKVLDSIVAMAAKVMKAPAANLMLLDENTGRLHWSANVGFPPEWVGVGTLKVGQSLSGLVVSTGSPLAVFAMSKDPRFLYPEMAERHGFHSFLGVPLAFRGKPIGGLYICTTQPNHFSGREIRLLSALADQAAFAIENARLFQETEKLAQENFRRYQEVLILNELGAAMRSTIQLDQLLPIILTGVTFGGGLGFNRAIIFLVDGRDEFLEGILGMGPSGGEEAYRIWKDLENEKSSLAEVCQSIQLDSLARSPFSLFARGLRIPLTREAGIIALTAIEKRSFNAQQMPPSDGRINPEFEGLLGTRNFATAPLLAKDKVIGVILVDNIFNQRPITDDDLRFLTALANQAGMAIETAQLYSRLEETNRRLLESHRQIVQMERLATLGEMSATVAHQIRNPLVSIGGFARRLSNLDPEKGLHRQYLDIIQREVRRLEEIVKDILSVSRETRPKLVPTDLNAIIRESLTLYEDRIKGQRINLRTNLQRNLPRIPLDPTYMLQALANLLDNALDTMPNGGDLEVSTFLSPEAAHLEIADSGPGILPENSETIFDPFFTTKVNGTGLGLTVTHRIVSQHGGKIEVKNLPATGAVFSISLPLEAGISQTIKEAKEVI